jgi:hypothetical protein
MQVEQEKNRYMMQLSNAGDTRYSENDVDFNPAEYDVKVFVTNEEMDKGVTINNLLTMLKIAPQFAQPILEQAVDLMGLDSNKFKNQSFAPQQQMGQPDIPSQDPTALMTQANTMQNA